jgi:hypothetical protein
MKTLLKDIARCAGKYTFYTDEVCPKRDTCLRYLAFTKLDREAGIKHYRNIPVMMAIVGCKMFIDGEAAE